MIFVIDNTLFDVEPRFPNGHVLTAGEAAAFQPLWLDRITWRWRQWHCQNPTATASDLQLKLTELASTFRFEAPSDDGPIVAEARAIATAIIEQQLQASGLPVPKNLDDHVTALSSSTEVMARARQVVEARLTIKARMDRPS